MAATTAAHNHVVKHSLRRHGQPRTIGIIGARGAVDVFHPAPFGVVDILDAFDVRN